MRRVEGRDLTPAAEPRPSPVLGKGERAREIDQQKPCVTGAAARVDVWHGGDVQHGRVDCRPCRSHQKQERGKRDAERPHVG